MDKSRLLMIVAVVAIFAVVVLGFVVGIQPQLQATAAANMQQQTVEQTNETNQRTLDALAADFKDLPKLNGELAALRLSVPSTANLSVFLNSVYASASASGVVVSSWTPSDPVAYAPQAGAPATAGSGSTTPGASPTATPTPTPTATPSPSAAPPASTLPTEPTPHSDPSITSANFVAIPVSIGVNGSLANSLSFVHQLQNGSRLFLVTGISGGTGGGGSRAGAASGAPTDTYTVSGYVYVLARPNAG